MSFFYSASFTSFPAVLDIERFRTETLIAHNQRRAQHGTAPLALSLQLCEGAQQWAEHLAKCDGFERSPENEYYSENIACTWGSHLTGTLVTRIWYEEGKDYDFEKAVFSRLTQNFTQVIWKETREIGVGRARTKHGKEIIVARYHPPGNNGDFHGNVQRRSVNVRVVPAVGSLVLNRIPGNCNSSYAGQVIHLVAWFVNGPVDSLVYRITS